METKNNSVFQNSSGDWSSARIGAFMIILVVFLTAWIVIVDKEYVQASILFTSLAGTAITLYILGKNKDNENLKIKLGAKGLESLTN